MLILSQNKEELVYCLCCRIDKTSIWSFNTAGQINLLGTYDSKERAMEVLREIGLASSQNFFEMPKE